MIFVPAVACGLVAGVLMSAAASKIVSMDETESDLAMVLGGLWRPGSARALVAVELGLALGALAPWELSAATLFVTRLALVLAGLTFLLFGVVLAIKRTTSGVAPCSCFGNLTRTTNSWTHIIANGFGGIILVLVASSATSASTTVESVVLLRLVGVHAALVLILGALVIAPAVRGFREGAT